MAGYLDGEEDQRISPGTYSSPVRPVLLVLTARAHYSFLRLQLNSVSIIYPVLHVGPACSHTSTVVQTRPSHPHLMVAYASVVH